MISKTVLDKLNYQLNREIFSAYFYLSMSSYANYIGLKGFAHWFDVQIQEELSHSTIFYNYINDQSCKVVLFNIEAPNTDFISPLDLFEKTLIHEYQVTKLINNLVFLAREEKDYATDNLLSWFVKEQVEEESNVNNIITKLKFIKDDGIGVLNLDTELSQRIFVPPVVLQGK